MANFFQKLGKTVADIGSDILYGATKSVEGIYDLGVGLVGTVGGLFDDDFADKMAKHQARDIVGEDMGLNRLRDKAEENSWLKDTAAGNFIEEVSAGVGNMLPSVALSFLPGGAVLSLAALGASAAGNASEEAVNDGAEMHEAFGYGLVRGGTEIATEKLLGGATKYFTKADDLLKVSSKAAGKVGGEITEAAAKKAAGKFGSVASTGVKRFVKDSLEEAGEEVISELANPLSKSIYKGRDALSEYGDSEYWQGVLKSGAVGGVTGGVFTGTAGQLGHKIRGTNADISSAVEANNEIEDNLAKAESRGELDSAVEKEVRNIQKENLRIIEGKLKQASPDRRGKYIKNYGLSSYFDDNGSLKPEWQSVFNGSSEGGADTLDKRYYSVNARGKEAQIENDLKAFSKDTGKPVTAFKGELTEKAKSNFTRLKGALYSLNKEGGANTSLVIVEPNDSFFGAEMRGDKLYIAADVLESDANVTDILEKVQGGSYGGTFFHEHGHTLEGTKEYNELVGFLEDDTELSSAAADRVVEDYGIEGGRKTVNDIKEKIEAGVKLTRDEARIMNKFSSEYGSIMIESSLDSEHFINRLVNRNASLAEKVVYKIEQMKEALRSRTDERARAERKRLIKAENLYLKAARAAGNHRLENYILSRISEEDEKEVDSEAERIKYSYAGEKEARDVANRANMTDEQRKNTRPDIDREDVVFAGAVGKSARRFSMDETSISLANEFSDYPYNMQTVIADYINYSDKNVENFIKDALNETNQKRLEFMHHDFSNDLPENVVKDINAITGFDVSNYGISINGEGVHHINRMHGKNGKHDHSMREIKDIARIQYIISNADKADVTINSSGEVVKDHQYRNSDNTESNVVSITKRINGTYYVVCAVPDSKAKKMRIKSAYISKKEANQEFDANNAPNRTSKTNLDLASDTIIDDSKPKSNTSDENFSENFSNDGKTGKIEAKNGEIIGHMSRKSSDNKKTAVTNINDENMHVTGENNNDFESKRTSRITADMSDTERAEILSKKQVVAPMYTGQADASILANKSKLESGKIGIVASVIQKLGDDFGVVGEKINIKDAEVVITLSKSNLRKSVTAEATPEQLAKLIPILKSVAKSAIGIERHDNRYFFDSDTVYFDNLLGGYIDGNNFVPVRFGLKHSRTGNAVLYVVVDQNKIPRSSLTEIKKTEVVKTPAANADPEVSRSATYSIAQIIEFVNSGDLLRYIPDEMLTEAQKTTKYEAIAKTIERTNTKNDERYAEYISNGDLDAAKQMVFNAAKAAGYTIHAYHGSNADFNVFEQSKEGAFGEGVYFAESKEYAQGFAPNGMLYDVFLRIANPYEAKYPGGITKERLIAEGYDGVHHEGNGFWVAFYPEQIKSAVTITYDDNGNIVPISQRFNAEKTDIRYSRKSRDGNKVTMSKGEHAKQKANINSDKVFSRGDIINSLKKVKGLAHLFSEANGAPKKAVNDFVDKLWQQLNSRYSDIDRKMFLKNSYDEIYGIAMMEREEGYRATAPREEIWQFERELGNAINEIFDSGKESLIERTKRESGDAQKRVKEANERHKALGKLMAVAEKMRSLKLFEFFKISNYKSDSVTKALGKLARINFRGNVNVSGARKYIASVAEWYSKDNPMLKGRSEGEEIFGWGSPRYIEHIAYMLKRIATGEGTFSDQEILELLEVMTYFNGMVETFFKVKKDGEYMDAMPLAKEQVKDIKENQKLRVGLFGSMYKKPAQKWMRPSSIANRADMYSENGFFTQTLNEFREGKITAEEYEYEMMLEMNEFNEKNKNYFSKLNKRIIDFEDHKMTVSRAITLYMTAKRKQAFRHLALSGFAYEDGKTTIDYISKSSASTEEEYAIRAGEIQNTLYEQFSEQDKEFIRIAEKIFKKCGELKYNTDMELHWHSNIIEGYYFPIFSKFVAKGVDSDFFDLMRGLENQSFNKHTEEKAKNFLHIMPITEVIERHVHGVANYAGLAVPIRNFDIMFNLDIEDTWRKPVSIRSEIEKSWPEAQEYFKKLVADMLGKSEKENAFLAAMRGNYAKFQLGFNPKTLATQFSSFFAASSVLDYDCLTRSIGMKGSDVDEYCVLAKLRNANNDAAFAQANTNRAGFFKKHNAVTRKTEKLGNALMAGIGVCDRFIITRLFPACQLQIEKNGGAKVGTKENKVEAGKLLKKVIFETQQNSFATERSEIMRSSNSVIKSFQMFRSDAMNVLCQFVDAVGETAVLRARIRASSDAAEIAKLKEKMKNAKRKLRKSMGAIVAVAIFQVAIAAMFNAFYHRIKDEDEDGTVLDEIAVDSMTGFVGNLIAGIPIISDIYSFFADGYTIDNYAVSMFNDALEAFSGIQDIVESAATNSYDGRQAARAVRKVIYSFGQFSGIPIRNMYNVTYGVLGFIPNVKYGMDNMFYKPEYKADLRKAVAAGDEDAVSTIMGVMTGENVGEIESKQARAELNRLVLKGFDNVLPRAIGDSIKVEGEEIKLTNTQKKQFKKIYSIANESIGELVNLRQYKNATDEVKATAVKTVYKIYYDLALAELGADTASAKNILFAEAIDIEQLALIISAVKAIEADKDKDGNAISGSRKKKVQAYIGALNLTAAQKYMIMGYLGYKNQNGEAQVKSYINRLRLTRDEKTQLLKASGY